MALVIFIFAAGVALTPLHFVMSLVAALHLVKPIVDEYSSARISR